MTAVRMKVVSRLVGFVGALCLVGLVVILTMTTVVQNLGAAVEALALIGTPETLTERLPLGSWAAFVLEGPTFRTMVATMFATGLWLTTFLSVRGLVLLVEDGRRSRSLREFVSEHLLHGVLFMGVFVAAILAAYFEWRLWLLRASADLAQASVASNLKPWVGGPIGSGGTWDDEARHVARVGALAVPGIAIGLAIGLEASFRWCGRAWVRLGAALDDLRGMTEADTYLDEVVSVIGADRACTRVTRRTAIANPQEYALWNDQVFAQKYVQGLENAPVEEERNSVLRRRPRGFLARLLTSGFVLALVGGSHGSAAADEVGPAAVVVHAAEPMAGLLTVLRTGDLGTAVQAPGMLKLIFAVDFSGTTKATTGPRVEAVRATLKGLAQAKPNDPRHRPRAGVEIYLLSVDSLSEVVWSGTELTVDELTDDWWTNTAAERQGYSACTSLVPMWRKIGELIRTASPCDRVDLVILSDLIGEESGRGGPLSCGSRQIGPAREVPWKELGRVNRVRAYHVPSAVKAAWRKPLHDHQLDDRFLMYAAGDPSGRIPISLPPEACKPTGEEQAKFNGFLKKVGIIVGLVLVVIAALPFFLG